MRILQAICLITVFAVLCIPPVASAKPPGVSLSGGDGSSLKKAIIVKAPNEESGVRAEYEYIRQHYPGSKEGDQSLQESKGKSYDVMELTTAEGKKKTLYFDITAYFGK
jgi:hypothetical protein